MSITLDMLLAAGASIENANKYLKPLQDACVAYGIDTPAREAMFVAQTAEESGGYRYTEELWGPTPTQKRYDPPGELAGKLGNALPGDGKKYKGRAFIEVTGAFNYKRVRDRLREKFPDVPDFVADPARLADDRWCAAAAAEFWDDHGLNTFADNGDIVECTRVINGGLNGLADRKRRWQSVQNIMPGIDGTALAANDTPTPQAAALLRPVSPASSTPSPQENDVPPFALALLPSLMNAVPELVQLFGSNDPATVADKNAKAATIAINVAKDALNARNEQQLQETLDADPQARETVRQAIKDNFWQIQEAGGGGIAGARDANQKMADSGKPLWDNPAFVISLLIMLFPAALCVDIFWLHPDAYDSNTRTQIVTALLVVLSGVMSFWLGSSMGSAKKDDTISTLSK